MKITGRLRNFSNRLFLEVSENEHCRVFSDEHREVETRVAPLPRKYQVDLESTFSALGVPEGKLVTLEITVCDEVEETPVQAAMKRLCAKSPYAGYTEFNAYKDHRVLANAYIELMNGTSQK